MSIFDLIIPEKKNLFKVWHLVSSLFKARERCCVTLSTVEYKFEIKGFVLNCTEVVGKLKIFAKF